MYRTLSPPGYKVEEKKLEDRNIDNKSSHSYKSTHSSRSSVLERARKYNQRIETSDRRSKSLERPNEAASPSSRSKSAGKGARPSTRERAMASVQKDTTKYGGGGSNNNNSNSSKRNASNTRPTSQVTDQTHPLTPTSQYSHNQHHDNTSTSIGSSRKSGNHHDNSAPIESPTTHRSSLSQSPSVQQQASVYSRRSARSKQSQRQDNPDAAVVTPELLVDALSGHEDGLLAIAERLMEHYDAGYDVMGEAIIDAFADVQKLFQHVVEAAHMEGAAFEASRREAEMEQLRASGALDAHNDDNNNMSSPAATSTPTGPARHDEFIDQDVKDVLNEAIRKGSSLRDNNKHDECLHLYEQACQSASALLPVDSDHRGRLQLSIARAESMSADRACAILRYAMDDVIRSGMRAVKTPLPDPSQRADVVLSRPHHSSLSSSAGQAVQSSDEALASLMEEMKEILNAPIYNDTPLQAVSRRFWSALNDAQRSHTKNEEKLEQNLGKLKGEFLLARAEWEEKLNQSSEIADAYKEKYENLKRESRNGDFYLHQARSKMNESQDEQTFYDSVKNVANGRANSVASLSSGLAQHAKTVVSSLNNLNCNAMNERSSPMVSSSPSQVEEQLRSGKGKYHSPISASRSRSGEFAGRSRNRPTVRSFRDFNRSPQHMDI